MKFEFFDHTADLGVHVYGATLAELFQNAAAALYHALGRFHLKPQRQAETLRLRAGAPGEVLVEFLSELLYRFDVHRLVFERIEVELASDGSLTAHLEGAEVDVGRSQPNYEIKAVTYHQATVEAVPGGGYRATVVFDV